MHIHTLRDAVALAVFSIVGFSAVAQQQAQVAPGARPGSVASAPPPAQPAVTTGQSNDWVKASGAGPAAFPNPPTGAPATPASSPFPTTNYGSATYGGVQGAPQQQQVPGAHDGIAPLAPLSPPPSDFQRASAQVSPLTNLEIERLRELFDSSRKAKAYRPVRTSPRIRTASVDLSPGASLPILRTLPGESSTVVFMDPTGAPWPLAATPRVSRTDVAEAEWIPDSPAVVIDMLSPYEEANMTVFLKGLATPVVVKLSSGEPDGDSTKREPNGLKTPTTREVDYRLDLRVPGRSPYAKQATGGSAKISLYDDTLQAFLDGIPPQDAARVVLIGEVPSKTEVWQYDGALYVRTSDDIQSAFDNTLAASDGTRVYRLPPTPFVTLSDAGRSVTFQLDLH